MGPAPVVSDNFGGYGAYVSRDHGTFACAENGRDGDVEEVLAAFLV